MTIRIISFLTIVLLSSSAIAIAQSPCETSLKHELRAETLRTAIGLAARESEQVQNLQHWAKSLVDVLNSNIESQKGATITMASASFPLFNREEIVPPGISRRLILLKALTTWQSATSESGSLSKILQINHNAIRHLKLVDKVESARISLQASETTRDGYKNSLLKWSEDFRVPSALYNFQMHDRLKIEVCFALENIIPALPEIRNRMLTRILGKHAEPLLGGISIQLSTALLHKRFIELIYGNFASRSIVDDQGRGQSGLSLLLEGLAQYSFKTEYSHLIEAPQMESAKELLVLPDQADLETDTSFLQFLKTNYFVTSNYLTEVILWLYGPTDPVWGEWAKIRTQTPEALFRFLLRHVPAKVARLSPEEQKSWIWYSLP